MTCTTPSCGRADTRPYLRGNLCPDHAPHVPTPPPHGLTARGIPREDDAA